MGFFHAESIAKILNGAAPRRLNQIFAATPRLTINLDTSGKIGYVPSAGILLASDEIYGGIDKLE